MNGFWSVFRREVDERRLLLAGALLLGALPFAAGLLPLGSGGDLSRSRLEVAAALAMVAAGVTALVLGSSVSARDLAERRLGFYFQRPLSGWAIWGGKISAAAGLSLATGILIALPAVLADHVQIMAQPASGWLALEGIGALLAVLALSHAGSIILRARSPWLLLDLAGALGSAALVATANSHMVRAGAFSYRVQTLDILERGQIGLSVAVLVTAIAAGAAQILTGRTDLRRGHRVLSITLWAGMVAAALLFFGFARWVTWVAPTDLRLISGVAAAPAGSWIALSGPADHRPGYLPTFLLDTASGRFLTLPGVALDSFNPILHFSADGRRAVWLESTGRPGTSPVTLVVLDLAAAGSRPIATPLTFLLFPQALALSPTGDRIATIEDDRLNVYQLPGARIVASAAIPKVRAAQRHLRYPGDGRVRLFQGQDERWPLRIGMSYDVFDLELGGKPTWVPRSHFEALADSPAVQTSSDARYLLARINGRLSVLDVETGRQVLDLTPTEPGTRHSQFVFLADGRSLQVLATPSSRLLRLFDPTFREERRVVLGNGPLMIGGMLAPGTLVLAQARPQTSGRLLRFDSFRVDLASGAIHPLGSEKIPIWQSSAFGPSSLAPRLFLCGRGLVRIDPQTGRETVIVPTGSGS